MFPCSGCGLCCKHVGFTVAAAKALVDQGNIDSLVKEVAEFPFRTLAGGECENLLPDHSCAVYHDRPDVCSIDKTHSKHFSHLSQAEYYTRAIDGCNSLIIESRADEKYLINI